MTNPVDLHYSALVRGDACRKFLGKRSSNRSEALRRQDASGHGHCQTLRECGCVRPRRCAPSAPCVGGIKFRARARAESGLPATPSFAWQPSKLVTTLLHQCRLHNH